MNFNGLGEFVKHLEKLVISYKEHEANAANYLGVILEKEAKHKIGWLQQGSGPFNAWSPLAESTKADKERKGYVFNSDYNPLFRTGEMQDSISYHFNPVSRELKIGSGSEIMVYQEFGTTYIPARSVLGLTMYAEGYAESKKIFSKMLVDWVSGKLSNFETTGNVRSI